MKHNQDEEGQLVDTDEPATAMESVGEMIGYRIKDAADAATGPLAAYAATRPELSIWVRVPLGIVAATKAPQLARRLKRWIRKD